MNCGAGFKNGRAHYIANSPVFMELFQISGTRWCPFLSRNQDIIKLNGLNTVCCNNVFVYRHPIPSTRPAPSKRVYLLECLTGFSS